MTPKRTRKPVDAVESFLFEIETIVPDYSFGSGNPRFDRGAYSEHAHTRIVTCCRAPERFAGRVTTFVLIGDRTITNELNQPGRIANHPLGVGTLTMRGNRSEYLGSMPIDALFSLTQPIFTGALKYISLAGFRQRNSPSIRANYIAFQQEADLDDY